MENERLRVLVVAYECGPKRSHVAGSAWQIIIRLAKWHDLWIITEETEYQRDIEAYLRKHKFFSRHTHFFFIPDEGSRHGELARPIIPFYEMMSYKRWLKKTFCVSNRLHNSVNFDLVHHLRTNTFREPGFSWQLPIPFIWGPTGGTTMVPWCLMNALDIRHRILHTLRNMITFIQLYFSPGVRHAAKKAVVMLSQTSCDRKSFKKALGLDTILVHEQATDLNLAKIHKYDSSRPLQVMWTGRCVASKGLPIALKALSSPILQDKCQFHIVGDGPELQKAKILSQDIGIANSCVWHGWVPPAKVLEVMRNCDVFFFPSLLEATSTAVVQALSVGLPIICLNHCGFGDIVDKSCGIPVEINSVPMVIKEFTKALCYLLENPESVEFLSKGACKKARIYSWDNLVDVLNKAYSRATKNRDQQVNGHTRE